MKKLIALLIISSQSFAAMSRVQVVHTYIFFTGNSISYTSNNTAGNLLIGKCSQNGVTSMTVSDSQSNSWVSLAQQAFQSNTSSIRVFYVLKAKAGANSVTFAGGSSDMGCTIAEFSSGTDIWSIDSSLTNGSSFDCSTVGATTSPRTNAWSTAGTKDLIWMSYADEINGQASHTTVPNNFTEEQWDNTHIDADAYWLDATAQTSLQSGWNVATSMSTCGLYVAAFTAGSSGPGRISTNFGTGVITILPGNGSITSQ